MYFYIIILHAVLKFADKKSYWLVNVSMSRKSIYSYCNFRIHTIFICLLVQCDPNNVNLFINLVGVFLCVFFNGGWIMKYTDTTGML